MISGLTHRLALAATLFSTASLALPSVEGTTRIVIGAGYSMHTIEVVNPAEVHELEVEFEKLNAKTWREESIVKFGGKCMAHVRFIDKDQHGFTLYAYPDRLYWSPEGRKNPYKYLAVGPNDMPSLRRKASALFQGKRCMW